MGYRSPLICARGGLGWQFGASLLHADEVRVRVGDQAAVRKRHGQARELLQLRLAGARGAPQALFAEHADDDKYLHTGVRRRGRGPAVSQTRFMHARSRACRGRAGC